MVVAGIDDPLRLAYLLSSLLDMKAEEKQHILEEDDLTRKLEIVSTVLSREIALLEMKSKIESAAQQAGQGGFRQRCQKRSQRLPLAGSSNLVWSHFVTISL